METDKQKLIKELHEEMRKKLGNDFKWVSKYLSSIPDSLTVFMYKSFLGRLSTKRAIKAKCLECVGYARAEVTNCPSVGCPLYSHRPYQKSLTTNQKSSILDQE